MKYLKFRAWTECEKYMAYQGAPDLETLYSFMFHFADYKDCLIMQWTGLHDKNGKEIYCGDIVKGHDGFIYRVWQVAGGFAVNVHVETFKKDIKMDYPFPLQPLSDEQTVSYFEHSCEIIGNIYENPELLQDVS